MRPSQILAGHEHPDLNRVARGSLNLSLVPVQLAAVVREALLLLQAAAANHGITLDVSVPEDLMVQADELRLRQVLLNLGSNAVKYSLRGGTVGVRAVAAGAGQVELRVQDRGIGMTPEQLGRLFQPFERLGAERSKIPGTGLGLLIARSMVGEMGGTLEMSSQAQQGTTATLRLQRAV